MVECIGFEFKFSLNSNSFESVWKRKEERKLEIEKEDPNPAQTFFPSPARAHTPIRPKKKTQWPKPGSPDLAAQFLSPARPVSSPTPPHSARSHARPAISRTARSTPHSPNSAAQHPARSARVPPLSPLVRAPPLTRGPRLPVSSSPLPPRAHRPHARSPP